VRFHLYFSLYLFLLNKNFHEGRTQVEIGKIGRNLSREKKEKINDLKIPSISSASANCCAVSSLFFTLSFPFKFTTTRYVVEFVVNLKGKDKVKNKDETAQQLADALEIDKEEVLKN
jgi:hypothetical protein